MIVGKKSEISLDQYAYKASQKVPMSAMVSSDLAEEEPPAKRQKREVATTPNTSGTLVEELPLAVPPLGELAELVNYSKLETHEAVVQQFNALTRVLLLESAICIHRQGAAKDIFLEILELEYYLRMPGVHEDPFTHGSEEQRVGGRWYFHRAGLSPTSGYRGGTRKGLDLTIGAISVPTSSSPDIRGGILIRSVRRMSDKTVISGPCRVVEEILRLCGSTTIPDLVTIKWTGNTSAFPSAVPSQQVNSMTIVPKSSSPEKRPSASLKIPIIYGSPRIGLDLSHASIPTSLPELLVNSRVAFVARPYRNFIHPELLTANGRPQTFLGVYKHALDAHAEDNSVDTDELTTSSTGLKQPIVTAYTEAYQSGLRASGGTLLPFIGKAGKVATAGAAVPRYLKMVGVIDRVLSVSAEASET